MYIVHVRFLALGQTYPDNYFSLSHQYTALFFREAMKGFPLLSRPLIKRDMWNRYPRLVAMFHIELDQGKIIFDKQMIAGMKNDGKI